MAFTNPNDSTEILYSSSGDVRSEINAYAAPGGASHYVDEREVPGSSIIDSLVRATHEIDTYLEPVYANQLPIQAIASVPKMLNHIAKDLATYYVWRSNMARLSKMSDEKRQQYYLDHVSESEESMGTLAKLRERKMQLPEWTASYADEVKAVRSEGQAPIFDVDDEKNWNVDPRTTDDIERERGQ